MRHRPLFGSIGLFLFALALAACGSGGGAAAQTYTVSYDGHGNTGGNVPIDSSTYE